MRGKPQRFFKFGISTYRIFTLEHGSNAGQPGDSGRDGEVELHENDERDARVVVSHDSEAPRAGVSSFTKPVLLAYRQLQ